MIRIVPLGGMGKVTNNLFLYEYLEDGIEERLIVDCGIGFPDDDMLGADLLVPDVSYLEGKEHTIVGLCLTHGHDDHIAGLPYVLPQLDADFPIYASKLTAGFAQGNLKEFAIKKQIKIFPDRPFELGHFTIDPVQMTHSVPDTKHLVISTPEGVIYHGSDFKFDWTPVDGKTPDLQKMADYGQNKILALLTDCLRVENQGYSASESTIGENLLREMRDVKGKVIVTTMSSNIHRIQQAIDAAASLHRKVAFIGRSLEENVKVAQMLGFLHLPQKGIINKRQIKNAKPKNLCLIVAGSQGQIGSSLQRIARNEHTLAKIKEGDHVVFSADPIPGNENYVYETIDNLARLGATISYTNVQDDLHVSGHASADELRLMLNILKPKFIFPIGGNYRHMNQFKVLATDMGWDPQEVTLLKDGEIVGLSGNHAWVDDKIKLKTIIVDGLGIGDVGPLVLKDRRKMSQSGMVVVALPVNQKNQVSGRPEVATRGFVFAKENQDLLTEIKDEVSKDLPEGMNIKDWKKLRDETTNNLERFIFNKTQREPLILITIVKS